MALPNESVDLRMFELAEKYVRQSDPGFEIVGNYMSPCSDAYQKASLAPAYHRIQSRFIIGLGFKIIERVELSLTAIHSV